VVVRSVEIAAIRIDKNRKIQREHQSGCMSDASASAVMHLHVACRYSSYDGRAEEGPSSE
jgi:hypothetical protein